MSIWWFNACGEPVCIPIKRAQEDRPGGPNVSGRIEVSLQPEDVRALLDVAVYEQVSRERAEKAAMTSCGSAQWRRIREALEREALAWVDRRASPEART